MAYRQNAFVVPPGETRRYYDVQMQQWVTKSYNTYWVLLQGSTTIAEPNPATAILYGTTWFNYVRGWHNRF
jgi:hypothetical protein